MTRLSDQFDHTDLDDLEELLADKPRRETWELIGGRPPAELYRDVLTV